MADDQVSAPGQAGVEAALTVGDEFNVRFEKRFNGTWLCAPMSDAVNADGRRHGARKSSAIRRSTCPSSPRRRTTQGTMGPSQLATEERHSRQPCASRTLQAWQRDAIAVIR